MPSRVALLPAQVIVQVLRYGSARDAIALLLTGSSGTGSALFTLEVGVAPTLNVFCVCLQQETPITPQIIGLPIADCDDDDDDDVHLDLPMLELNPWWPGGYLHPKNR